MSAILVLWSWLRAAVGFGREQAAPDRPVIGSSRNSPRKKSCAETASEVGSAKQAQEKLRGARVLVGIRPDGGTKLRMRAPPLGWTSRIGRLRALARPGQRACVVEGRSVLIRKRGEVLEIHQPGRARLLVTLDHAELIAEARALDLGGIEAWGAEQLPWATRLLTGEACTGLRDAAMKFGLFFGSYEGWRVVELPLCVDLAGVVLRLADESRDRWVGVGKRTRIEGVPGDGDELATLYIGKGGRGLLLRCYAKGRQLQQGHLEDSAQIERLRQAGWDGREPVLRVEPVFDAEALSLRQRGAAGDEGTDFTDPGTLADHEALARLYAYAVGHPGVPRSGRHRLLDENGELDERWKLVQSAAAVAPVEQLAQVRARRQAERRARQQAAESRWVKSCGEVARFDGFKPGDGSAKVLEHVAERTRGIAGADITEALVRADTLVGDLLEQAKGGGEP